MTMQTHEHSEPLFDTLNYPHTPGYKAQATSAAAAIGIAPRAATLREQCREALRSRPMSADQCADYLGEDKLAIRPRFSELLRLGEIVDTGERVMNDSNRRAIVWGLK